MTKKQVVSPQSSGGAGTLFEYRVAAIAYSYLVTGTHPPGLQAPVRSVGLQQRVNGHLLDDVVLSAETGPEALATEYQVKLTIAATARDEPFLSVITQGLHVLHDRGYEVTPGHLDLGLAARGDQRALDQLRRLAGIARGHTHHRSFRQLFQAHVTDHELRDRMRHVRDAVETAICAGAPDLGGVEASAHAFLSRLHVWPVADHDDGADFLGALDRIGPLAQAYGTEPIALFGHLAAIAQDWGVLAGDVDADSVRRQLRRRGLGLRTASTGNQQESLNSKDAEAVSRGPVSALDLDSEVADAERLLEAGDPSAAEVFNKIASTLDANRYHPHAAMMRRREATARQLTSQIEAANLGRVELAWDHLDAAQVWEAGFALNDGAGANALERLTERGQRVQKVAEAAVWVAKGSELDLLIRAFDQLKQDDPFRERAAAQLCEEAVAGSSLGILLDRQPELEAIARAAVRHGRGPGRQCGARIQMCLADATGRWSPLLPELQRNHPRTVVAWAYARYGRHLALSGDGAGAEFQYLTAIERACELGMYDDAADWLYALRTVRFWYDDPDDDHQHPLAQALRADARPSRLPGNPHTVELALRAMTDETKPAEALQRARRWRWQAVVRGVITEEIDAVRAMGRLLHRRGDFDAAVGCFVRAGAEDEAIAAARAFSESPVRIESQPWPFIEGCRAAAFAAVAAAADLVSDDHACEWLAIAIDEIAIADVERRRSPSARMRAFEVVAAFRDFLSDNMIEVLLEQIDLTLDRRPNLNADESIVKILVTASRAHSTAVPLIARALQDNVLMADAVLRHAPDVLAAHRETFGELLMPTSETHEHVHLALVSSGIDMGPVRQFAADRVDQYLSPRDYPPGRIIQHNGAWRIAVYASSLDPETRNQVARTMLERALERREATSSRSDTLRGLQRLTDDLTAEVRESLLPSVMEIAHGKHDGGPTDDILLGDVRRFGAPGDADKVRTLADVALQLAARLATSQRDQAEIVRIGLRLLTTADEPSQWRIGRALAWLPLPPDNDELQRCAFHSSPALRALAAYRWAQDTSSLPPTVATQLAHDRDRRVRTNLAEAIHDNAERLRHDDHAQQVMSILASDNRRSILASDNRRSIRAYVVAR
jgi:hypothetical protein